MNDRFTTLLHLLILKGFSVDWHSESKVYTFVSVTTNILGKCDSTEVTLLLYADENDPARCPIRHLLAYIHLAKIKGGYLFPKKGWTAALTSNSDGLVTEDQRMNYETFNEDCKRVFNRLFNSPNQVVRKFGTHTIRRTGYVFAVWGKGVEQEIKHSARHLDQDCSNNYRKDASTILQLARENDQLQDLPIYTWKVIRLDTYDSIQGLCVGQSVNFKPLVNIAEGFVSAVAPASEGNIREGPIYQNYVIKKALEFRSEVSTHQQILAKFRPVNDVLLAEEFDSLLRKYARELRPNQIIYQPLSTEVTRGTNSIAGRATNSSITVTTCTNTSIRTLNPEVTRG